MSLWRILGWLVKLIPVVAVGLFLWYYLPGHDVVRIVDTDVKRMDRGSDLPKGDATAGVSTRDVRFINAVWPDGEPRVYRNEETGWGFPWYFKFDSGNLQTRAQDLRSRATDPRWVKVTHYGWRIEILSLFPNAIEVEEVEDPDIVIVPWFNIGFFVVLFLLLILIWRAWRWFVETQWKPIINRLTIEQHIDETSSRTRKTMLWAREEARDLADGVKARARRRSAPPPGD